ncbi:probable E3 ubiquitin-protein ligase ATL45 [Malania oleifera]|nr:probable E3 ubiquitin-protein ligase ATL45 [Malania oleifera]
MIVREKVFDCSLWQPQARYWPLPPPSIGPPDLFYVVLNMNHVLHKCYLTPTGHRVLLAASNRRSQTTVPVFPEAPADDAAVGAALSPFLSAIGAGPTDRDRMLQKLARYRRSDACVPGCVAMTVVAVTVELYEESEVLETESGMEASLVEAAEFRAVPATTASVAALETATVDGPSSGSGTGSGSVCVICLEEFLVGSEVRRMPCSHVFHGDCIVQWLGKSHFCPLCRFSMPH